MMDAEPGQNIDDFAAELIFLAWQTNKTVYGRHNSNVLEAKVGSTRQQVLLLWNESQKRSYFGG